MAMESLTELLDLQERARGFIFPDFLFVYIDVEYVLWLFIVLQRGCLGFYQLKGSLLDHEIKVNRASISCR
jgi:hypothetical protein